MHGLKYGFGPVAMDPGTLYICQVDYKPRASLLSFIYL